MATKKKESAKSKANGATKQVEAEAPLTPEEMAALGYGTDSAVPLGGKAWPKIRVEKFGLSIAKDNGVEAVNEVEGVIIHHHPYRSYYASKDTTNSPPDCFSADGIFGSRFGACGTCPHSFDAAMQRARAEGKTKPSETFCREGHQLYVVRSPAEGPLGLRVSITSLKNLKAFFNQVKHFASVVTRFTSVYTKDGSNEWGILQFSALRPAPRDLLIQIAPMAKNLQLTAARQAALPEHAESSASPNTF